MTNKNKGRVCAACGKGMLARTARAGRTDVYKGVELPLPPSLALVECSSCGERYVTPSDAEKIDTALAEAYIKHVRTRIEADIEKLQSAGVSLASIERELGLSEGYLSKVRKSAEPSFQLVALLTVIAENPAASLSIIHRLHMAVP